MSDDIRVLAQNGLDCILGFSPKVEDIIPLECSENYVRFHIREREDVEYSVTFTREGYFVVTAENGNSEVFEF